MKSPREPFMILSRPVFDGRMFALFIIIAVSLWVVFLFAGYFSPRPSTTLSITSRGAVLIVIRLPPVSNHLQEDILISDGREQTDPKVVIRGPSDAARSDVSITGYTRRPLTAIEWEALNAVRVAWCQHAPQFQPVQASDIFYDIALRCGNNYESEAFIVPPNQLPDAFAALIEAIPSPQGMR